MYSFGIDQIRAVGLRYLESATNEYSMSRLPRRGNGM